MKIAGIIPSRFSSTRFPGKPLADIFGMPMIQRVYQQALKAKLLSDVVVATDDSRIMDCVNSFGGKAMMTSGQHLTGTDRCAEVAEKLFSDYDAVINIQGDEPFISPDEIDALAKCFESSGIQIATLIKKAANSEELFNHNRIKVVVDNNMNALYFSRSPIPYLRDVLQSEWVFLHKYFLHIGIYGFKVATLKAITGLNQSPLEKAESLEQLRWLENAYSIKTVITNYESISVDTPDDLKKLDRSQIPIH